MKKITLIALASFCIPAMAQDPYLNNTIINTSDIYGTSRFVAMGGAMGALGAEISIISSNPAGMGMITKNEASLTAGVSWMSNNSAKRMASGTFGMFDQVGAITPFKSSSRLRNINFAFNYQKKADFNNCFFGETLSAASWADQLFGLACNAYDNITSLYGIPGNYYNTLYGLANKSNLFRANIEKNSNDPNNTLSVSAGSLNAYEFNISMNLDDRYFFGITFGLDNLDYYRLTDYWEQRTDSEGKIQDFGYVNEQSVTGTGFNVKLGAIIRPIESKSFRIGLAVETPTWYNLQYTDNQSLSTKYNLDNAIYDSTPHAYYTYYVSDLSDSNINDLNYQITTPWKLRIQAGSTISTNFAWGIEYEFANYPGVSTRYPTLYDGTTIDEGFKDMTETMFNPQHTIRAGMEFKPLASLSLRAGYNYITTITTPDSFWDPSLSDNSLAYPTGLDYMNLSDVHIATLGIGYRHKWFYADLAYKYRHQEGDYYAFDSYYSNIKMSPIPVDLSKHSITATVGFRF